MTGARHQRATTGIRAVTLNRNTLTLLQGKRDEFKLQVGWSRGGEGAVAPFVGRHLLDRVLGSG